MDRSDFARWRRAVLVGLALAVGLLAGGGPEARVGAPAPDIASSVWLNGKSVTMSGLRGRVVLVEFWTFGCYNCRNVEPYVKEWHEKYAGQGLVVIGVHSPEFKYEHNVENVKRYVEEHHITYAVPIDNDFANWNRYGNRYWPALYLIDKQGVIRYVRVGEGGYQETEHLIRTLLAEKG
jgi:thiol-disulfide isomerase/thioredoxin